MMNAINNHEEDEIRKSRVWIGGAMRGTWDGSGIWHGDKTWSGRGKWEGGALKGNWDINGKWEEEGGGIGTWDGKGKVVSELEFPSMFETRINVIRFFLIIIAAALGLFKAYGPSTAIIIIIVIALLTELTKNYLNPTTNGKLWLKGSWKDEGEFRILDLTGDWKLGYHRGIIKGKMKDPKPKDQEKKNKKAWWQVWK